MKIKIYAIGKIKEDYLKIGINEYLKKIKPYSQIEIIEVNDEPIYDASSESEIEQAKDKEGQKILQLVKSGEYLIGLDLNKKEYTSPLFSEYLNKKLVDNGASISFVIGGSYGLSEALKKRCNDSISLSQMTFLHQMTRLILLEQIYRAFKILRNETYHK
ncbi:MAG: 23S rRNA (pseudouridine(1915)-N(3))-methyltransferase RlmH [Bacilli bacterium]|nr:23S rRNA (pseudouridine(1915)-N(3))-methyltransferase RlmH [Bacilli bacterium]